MAQATAPKTDKAPKAPTVKIDFSAVTVGEAPAFETASREASVKNTPFPAEIAASWAARQMVDVRRGSEIVKVEHGAPRQATVPTAAVTTAKNLIRQAAKLHKVGVRFGQETVEDGMTTITYRAQTVREFNGRKPKGAAKA